MGSKRIQEKGEIKNSMEKGRKGFKRTGSKRNKTKVRVKKIKGKWVENNSREMGRKEFLKRH